MASTLSLRLEMCEKFIQDEVAYVRSRLKEYFPIINSRFKDFTLHDESHISAIESILDWLLTEQTLEELNDYDIFCLICSIWAHDIGLGSTVEEIRKFCEHKQIPHPEDNLRTKFVRDNHASLSREIIKKIIAAGHDPRLTSLSDIIGQIAESHVFGNLEQIDACIPVTVTGQIVKPLFLAIIIRLADILHCTHDRAPWILYKARKIEDTVSILHWKRHHATVGVNYDNNTDAYHFHVQTDDIKTFEWAVEYVKMINSELDYCAAICSKYNIKIQYGKIVTFKAYSTYNTKFIPEVIKVDIDPIAAINTFTGTYLYDDKSIVIRELMQNAIDAFILRKRAETYILPSISIRYNSTTNLLTVSDNGIGMTLGEIKGNLLKSCSSGFRNTKQSEDLIAKFGIGFLSVFIVAESITLKTRSLNSLDGKGYTARITNIHDPIEVREFDLHKIGTIIEISIKKGVTFTELDLIKWAPFEKLKDWVEFEFDGKCIKYQERDTGYSIKKEFSTKYLEYDDDIFSLQLRGSIYGDKVLFPCGLSFQSLNSFPEEIIKLPDLKKYFYIGGVPLISSEGRFPSYEKGGKGGVIGPLFERYFIPIDFNLKKPGLIELNLPRNGFIHSNANEILFHEIDNRLVDLINDFYKYLLSQSPHSSIISAALISEYWLTRSESKYIFPKQFSKHHQKETLNKLRTIWGDVLCEYLKDDYSVERKAFINSLNYDFPTIFINHLLINVLKNINYDLKQLFTNLRKHFGDIQLIQSIPSPLREIDIDAFLSIMAQSIALYDLYESRIWHPPVRLFHFKNEDYFPEFSNTSIAIFGSELPICGYLSYGLGTGQIRGMRNNAFQIIVNKNSNRGDLSHFISQLEKYSDQIRSFRLTPREDILSKLATIGVNKEFQTMEFIHPCLRNPFPYWDDFKEMGTYYDLENSEVINFKMGGKINRTFF